MLLGGLAALARFPDSVPGGFRSRNDRHQRFPPWLFWGSISWLRNRTPPLGPEASAEKRAEADDRRQRRQIASFTVGLFLVALLVAVAVWISPTYIGRFLGSMVVAYFAFGAILALVNVFEFAVDWTAKRQGIRREGEASRRRRLCARLCDRPCGVVNAWLHPFHRVRLCDGDCVASRPCRTTGRPLGAAATRLVRAGEGRLCEGAWRRARADAHRRDGRRRHPRRLLDGDGSREARGRFRGPRAACAPISSRSAASPAAASAPRLSRRR